MGLVVHAAATAPPRSRLKLPRSRCFLVLWQSTHLTPINIVHNLWNARPTGSAWLLIEKRTTLFPVYGQKRKQVMPAALMNSFSEQSRHVAS